MKANPSRNRIKGNRGGIGKPIRAPSEALRRLEAASVKNIRIAKLTVAIFGAILGQEQNHLFPSYREGLLEWRHFPAKLQKDFRALMDWALSSALLVLNEVYNSFEKITSAVGQIRRRSLLGRRFWRGAKRLMMQYSPLSVLAASENIPSVRTYELMHEDNVMLPDSRAIPGRQLCGLW